MSRKSDPARYDHSFGHSRFVKQDEGSIDAAAQARRAKRMAARKAAISDMRTEAVDSISDCHPKPSITPRNTSERETSRDERKQLRREQRRVARDSALEENEASFAYRMGQKRGDVPAEPRASVRADNKAHSAATTISPFTVGVSQFNGVPNKLNGADTAAGVAKPKEKQASETKPAQQKPTITQISVMVAKKLATDKKTTFEQYYAVFYKFLNKLESRFGELRHPSSEELRSVLAECPEILWVDRNKFWYYDRATSNIGRLNLSVERIACVNTEYSARYFYKQLKDLMSQLKIVAPSELYALLKVAHSDDPDYIFGPNLSICIGTPNRKKQIKKFVENAGTNQLEKLAANYEERYGFPQGTAVRWISQVMAKPIEPSSSSYKDLGSLADLSIGSTLAATSTWSDFVENLVSMLNGPCCDLELISVRLNEKVPNAPAIRTRSKLLEQLGYYISDNLLFQVGIDPNTYFARLLTSTDQFCRGDKGFSDAVFKNPTFEKTLKERLRLFDIFEISKGNFVSYNKLSNKTGIEKADIEDYLAEIQKCVGIDVPFTMYSLQANHEFDHPLIWMAKAADLDDFFFERILDQAFQTKSCRLAGTRVFIFSERKSFSGSDFLAWVISQNEGIEQEDLLYLLSSDYGITCSDLLLFSTTTNAGVYHDDIGDGYYSTFDTWRKMIKDELA